MTARLSAAVLVILATAPLEAAAGPRNGGLPRLEFEMPAPVEQPGPIAVPGAARGVMGYRLPLVSRRQVPEQVVSGVLIPAHTTYVILRPGYWEPVGLTADDVEAVPVVADAEADDPPAIKPGWRGWNLFRLFRRSGER